MNKYKITLFLSLILSFISQAQTPLKEVRLVGDIDNTMPSAMGDIYSGDDAILAFDVLNSQTVVSSNDLGILAHAEIDGYHASIDGCGLALYSLDTNTEISNVVMRKADVFSFEGNKILDASAEGIPRGVNVDAISRHPVDCDLILSIDTIAEIDGSVYFPSDLIRYNAIDGFALLHRFGFTTNVDAIHLLSASTFLLSVDTTSSINGVTVFDDDVFEFDVSNNTTVINFSPETHHSSWQSADVNALWAKQAQAGTIQWQLNSFTVAENVGVFNLMINRSGGTDGEVVVSIASEDGVAMAGVDFVEVNTSVSLADGQNSVEVAIAIIDDALLENIEDFTVSITNVTGGAQVGSFEEIEIIITDNDAILIFKDGFEN